MLAWVLAKLISPGCWNHPEVSHAGGKGLGQLPHLTYEWQDQLPYAGVLRVHYFETDERQDQLSGEKGSNFPRSEWWGKLSMVIVLQFMFLT